MRTAFPARSARVSSTHVVGRHKSVFLVRPPGVYHADSDTSLLIDVLRAGGYAVGRRVLDVGTGTGALALAAARCGAASVTAVHLSLRSVARHGLTAGCIGWRARYIGGIWVSLWQASPSISLWLTHRMCPRPLMFCADTGSAAAGMVASTDGSSWTASAPKDPYSSYLMA